MKLTLLLFLLVSTISYGQRSDFIHINFKKADSIALSYKGESLTNLPVLTHKLTANLTSDVEKFRAIYTWVSTNIENDYNAYLKTKGKRQKLSKDPEALTLWNDSFTPKVFQKIVTHRKTACTGYAYLIRELASLVDINCKIIDGYGRTATLNLNSESLPNHSWNAVELNGKWYLCDATWSAGRIVFEENQPKFKSEYHDGYFLANPALFVKNHYPLQIAWTLLSKPPTFSQFLDGPIVYKEAFQSNIISLMPSKMKFEMLKNETVLFKLGLSNTPINKPISLLLNSGNSSENIQPKITQNQKECIIHHSFNKSGIYDVHIKVEDVIIATYVVKVKRK